MAKHHNWRKLKNNYMKDSSRNYEVRKGSYPKYETNKTSKWSKHGLDQIKDNLSEAMKSNYLENVRANLKGRILDSPWSRIPNCSELIVEVGFPIPIFKNYGIIKKTKSTIKILPANTGEMNRYIEHQIIRLRKAKSDLRPSMGQMGGKVYWAIASAIMKRSNCFRVLAMNHVFTNWHRRYPLHFIVNVNRKVSRILNMKSVTLDYKRVYIPKSNNGLRPLGVPTPEWRVVLHMYSNFITYWVKDKLSENLHGFLPGKGTLTCWQDILKKKVMSYNYVKEWDFNSFFDTIDLKKVIDKYIELQIPFEIIKILNGFNEQLVRFKGVTKMDEYLMHQKYLIKELHNWGRLGKKDEATIRKNIEESDLDIQNLDLKEIDENIVIRGKYRDHTLRDLVSSLQLSRLINLEIRNTNVLFEHAMKLTRLIGVPQGAATSPITGNLIMDEWMKSDKFEKIAYADDSIGFSNNYVQEIIPKNCGISINEKKSGWIRFRGRQLKPLKFLGLIWDGKNLKADTRKGSKLEANENIKELLTILDEVRYKESCSYEEAIEIIKQRNSEWEWYSSKSNSWERWFTSKLAGFIQSRLYLGEWEVISLNQCFKYEYFKGSWCSSKMASKITATHKTTGINKKTGLFTEPKTVKGAEKLNVFNSSSFACYSLGNIFRWNQMCKIGAPIDKKIGLKIGN